MEPTSGVVLCTDSVTIWDPKVVIPCSQSPSPHFKSSPRKNSRRSIRSVVKSPRKGMWGLWGGFSGAEVWMKVTSCTQIPQPRLLVWHWNPSILQQLAAVDPEGFFFRTCLVEGSQILIRFSWLGERIVQARIEDPQDSMKYPQFCWRCEWSISKSPSPKAALVLMLVPRVYHVMVQGLASNWVMISHPKKYGRWVYRGENLLLETQTFLPECPSWGKAPFLLARFSTQIFHSYVMLCKRLPEGTGWCPPVIS